MKEKFFIRDEYLNVFQHWKSIKDRKDPFNKFTERGIYYFRI